jgi:hypothetical protein
MPTFSKFDCHFFKFDCRILVLFPSSAIIAGGFLKEKVVETMVEQVAYQTQARLSYSLAPDMAEKVRKTVRLQKNKLLK